MGDEMKDLKDEEKADQPDPKESKSSNWILAVVLIVVGVGLLGSNLAGFSFDNWWALFLFIPAGMMFKNVYADYQGHGRLTNKSTGPLIAGLAILVMIVIFLFDLSWSGLWPLAFVFGGIAVLLSSRS